MGVAPGSPTAANRVKVYVFDHMVEKLARAQLVARVQGKAVTNADKAQILGHAIAHEIGHLLLSMASHSRRGIMQASWGRDSMKDMALGTLTFEADEIKRIQQEVQRRRRDSIEREPQR